MVNSLLLSHVSQLGRVHSAPLHTHPRLTALVGLVVISYSDQPAQVLARGALTAGAGCHPHTGRSYAAPVGPDWLLMHDTGAILVSLQRVSSSWLIQTLMRLTAPESNQAALGHDVWMHPPPPSPPPPRPHTH